MNTANYSLFYDDQCPFCIWYSSKFVNWGILRAENRKPFEKIQEAKYDRINRELAKNQIALYNEDNHTVQYGADSMITLLAIKVSWINIFLSNPVLHFIAQQVYLFISYNRKVFAPTLSCASNGCQPDFHLGYRISLILMTALFTGLILNSYTASIYQELYGRSMPALWEWLVCLGQLFFQGAMVLMINPRKTWDYLGQMSLVSFLGGVALLPMLAIKAILDLNVYLTIGYFGIIVGLMLLLHAKRVSIIAAPKILSATWVIYRILVLLIMSQL